MKRKLSSPSEVAELRRRAEARLSEKQESQRSEAGAQRAAHDMQNAVVVDITEGKEAEEEIRRLAAKLEQQNVELTARNQELLRSEQKLLLQSTALETAANAVFITDTDGIILWVNSAFVTLTGYTSEEAIGKTPRLLKSGQHSLEFYKTLWTTLLAGRTWRGSFTNRRKDGSFYHDEHTLTPVRSKDGEITHFIAIMNDVTERKQVEEALSRSEAILQTVTNSARVGLVMLDAECRYVFANTAYYEVLGLGNAEIVGKRVQDVWPHLYDQMRPRLNRAYDGERVSYELRIPRREGTEGDRFYAVAYEPRTDPSSGVRIVGVVLDITERKRAEAILRGQAQLLDLAHDAIFVTDQNDRITYWNLGAKQRYGWSQEEALGKHTQHLLQTIFPRPLEEIRAILLKEGCWEGELMHTSRDGSQIIVASRWSLQRDEHGNPAGFLEVNNDVTERRLTEQLRLENVRLEERSRLLEEANRIKSEFLANMSHELRTPLNGIIGFAEFLADGKPGGVNPKQKELLEDILNSGKHLLQLISDILDMTKVLTGKMELHPERFSLRTAIEEICAASDPMAQKVGIHIDVDIALEIGDVLLDREKFKQVLDNLLSNAIKFNHDGGKVEVSAKLHDTGRVELVVKDTGIGIKPEDVDRLFKEFAQLDSGIRRRHEGTGLGLALTRKIVELQCGTIGVESEFGRGSTFMVVLPLITAKVNV